MAEPGDDDVHPAIDEEGHRALFATIDGRYIDVDLRLVGEYDVLVAKVVQHSSPERPPPNPNFLGMRRGYFASTMRYDVFCSLLACLKHHRLVVCGTATVDEVKAELDRQGVKLHSRHNASSALSEQSLVKGVMRHMVRAAHLRVHKSDKRQSEQQKLESAAKRMRSAGVAGDADGDDSDAKAPHALPSVEDCCPATVAELLKAHSSSIVDSQARYAEQFAEVLCSWPPLLKAVVYIHDPMSMTEPVQGIVNVNALEPPSHWHGGQEARLMLAHKPKVYMEAQPVNAHQITSGHITPEYHVRFFVAAMRQMRPMLNEWPLWLEQHVASFCMLCCVRYEELAAAKQLNDEESTSRPSSQTDDGVSHAYPEMSKRIRHEVRNWVTAQGATWVAVTNATTHVCDAEHSLPRADRRAYDIARHLQHHCERWLRMYKPFNAETSWEVRLMSWIVHNVWASPCPNVVFAGDDEAASPATSGTHTWSTPARQALADALALRKLTLVGIRNCVVTRPCKPCSRSFHNANHSSRAVATCAAHVNPRAAIYPPAWATKDNIAESGNLELAIRWQL